MEKLLIACDFDGTITERDTLHLIVARYGERGLWDAIEPRLRAGELTLEQAMQEGSARCARPRSRCGTWCCATQGCAPASPSSSRGRAGAATAWWCCRPASARSSTRCWSAGGLGHLEIASHDAEFHPEGCRLVWADRGERCAICGRPCKRHDLRSRHAGETLVLVGDGVSDRCVARMADVVFARAHLARDLTEDGVPFTPFEDFHEVRERLDARTTLAA